jgi:hypothetical protein
MGLHVDGTAVGAHELLGRVRHDDIHSASVGCRLGGATYGGVGDETSSTPPFGTSDVTEACRFGIAEPLDSDRARG